LSTFFNPNPNPVAATPTTIINNTGKTVVPRTANITTSLVIKLLLVAYLVYPTCRGARVTYQQGEKWLLLLLNKQAKASSSQEGEGEGQEQQQEEEEEEDKKKK